MAVESQYSDSACADNPQKCEDWQSIGNVAERLKRRCEVAMSAGNAEVAEAYHAKLIDVEVPDQ